MVLLYTCLFINIYKCRLPGICSQGCPQLAPFYFPRHLCIPVQHANPSEDVGNTAQVIWVPQGERHTASDNSASGYIRVNDTVLTAALLSEMSNALSRAH